jgi:hypothetical protein
MVLDYAVAYEKGDWEKVQQIADGVGLDEAAVPPLYQAAVRWAEQGVEEVRAADREEVRAGGVQRDAPES